MKWKKRGNPFARPEAPPEIGPGRVDDVEVGREPGGTATGRGVDPWWLVQYNFETRDPAEVNWYLKHRVGCDKTTKDGQNLRVHLVRETGTDPPTDAPTRAQHAQPGPE